MRGGRGREPLYIECIYMLTSTASVSTMVPAMKTLRRIDVLVFREGVEWCY